MDLLWLFILLIVLISVGIAFYLFSGASKSETKTHTRPLKQPAEKDPREDLLALNLLLRKSSIASELIEISEAVIDQLLTLLPRIEAADSPSGDLAWTVKRIASEYLPNKCIHPYLKLSAEDRSSAQAIDQFKSNITGLSQELARVTDTLSKRDSAEFSTKAKFLSQKFNTNRDA